MKTPPLRRSVLLALTLLGPLPAHSQTWEGDTDRIWTTAANWNPGIPAFDSSTDLIFPQLTAPVVNGYSTILGGNHTVRSLSFTNTGGNVTAVTFQVTGGGAARSLTMGGGGGASISVSASNTSNVTIGNAGFSGTSGSLILADNLTVDHGGTGVLSFNRGITGAGFSVTKNGTGTMSFSSVGTSPNTFSGNLTINAGRLIANGFIPATDFNNASNAVLSGGVLEIRNATGNNKDYNLVGVQVTSPSSLAYNNTTNTTYSLTFSGTSSFALNAPLTVQNISANTTLNNVFNISRNVTGGSNLIVETYNNVSSAMETFSSGRVQLSGNNTGWSGNLEIAKGTAQLSGGLSMGNGTIRIGSTGDAFGAGLGFNQGNTTVNLANNITVASGGFRLLRNNAGPGTIADINILGNITLDGNLTVDHAGINATRSITLSGNITGPGGLNVTFVGPHQEVGSTMRVTGSNTYLGPTTVSSGTMILDGSITSDTTVGANATIGGNGLITGNLTLAPGGLFGISTSSTFDVTGDVDLDSSFGIASLRNLDGTMIDWSSIAEGTYTLIGLTTTDFSTISNFGFANRATDLGGTGKDAYFQNGSLQLVVVPEPTAAGLLIAGLLTLAGFSIRRAHQ